MLVSWGWRFVVALRSVREDESCATSQIYLEIRWLGPGQHLITCHLGSLTPGPIYRVQISSRLDLGHNKNYYLKIREEEVINM